MKLIIFFRRYFVFILFFFFSTLDAIDLPVFYRAPFFQGMPQKSEPDWATGFAVRYGAGSTSRSRNVGSHKRPLLSIYDSMDITQLGVGVDNPQMNTANYWGDATKAVNGIAPTGSLNGTPVNPAPNDGKIDINGRVRVQDLNITLQQTLFAGFFAQVDLPIRWMKLDSIQFNNLGSAVLNTFKVDAAGVQVLNPPVNVNDFLTNVNTGLPAILKESGFVFNNLTDPVTQTYIPEFLVSGGWAGYNDDCFNIVESVQGSLQLGIVVPVGKQKNEDHIFEIPLGYNNLWGFNGRIKAEVGIWKFFAAGAGAGVTVFMREERFLRMRTSMTQSGWISLEKGRAEIDPGPVWDLSGYVKAENFVGGLSCLIGGSFVRQEKTILHVKDDNFLSAVVTNGLAPVSLSTVEPLLEKVRFISKNAIVNTDQRFKLWDQYVAHFFLQYDVKAHTDSSFAPLVAFEYSYPVTGRRYFMADMIAGTAALQVSWKF